MQPPRCWSSSVTNREFLWDCIPAQFRLMQPQCWGHSPLAPVSLDPVCTFWSGIMLQAHSRNTEFSMASVLWPCLISPRYFPYPKKDPVLCCTHLTKRADDHSMCFCFCQHLPGMFKQHGHIFSFILKAVKWNTHKANHRTNKSYTKLYCCLSYALWPFPLDYFGVCGLQQWVGDFQSKVSPKPVKYLKSRRYLMLWKQNGSAFFRDIIFPQL